MFSKIAKRIICILICVSMIVSVNACSSGSSDKKYTIYYTNNSRDKLIARDCKIDESASVEEKVKALLDDMNIRSSSKDEYVIKPENVNLLEVNVKGKTVNLNYTTTYKQMNSQTELLFRAAVVKMVTQIDDIVYVHFYIDGKEAEYEDGSIIGLLKSNDLRSLTAI